MFKKKIRALAALLSAVVAATALGGAALAAEPAETAYDTGLNRADIIAAMDKANDYWQANNAYDAPFRTQRSYATAFWHMASYHTGNMEAYYVTGNEKYRTYSRKWSDYNGWTGNNYSGSKESWTWGYSQNQGTNAVLFGDWQICFQTYIDLYNIEHALSEGETADERKIARTEEVMGYQITKSNDDFWWWADSLYMVPPIMVKLYQLTENVDYLDALYRYYRYAMELMYDGENGIPTNADGYTTSAWGRKNSGSYYSDPSDYKHLFYRDAGYVYPLEPNGGHEYEKNFWARGNGWVFAGLAKILNEMPTDYEHYEMFETLYKELAEAIIACQCTDDAGRGFWTQSMLQNYPIGNNGNDWGYETSGTAFFTYGLAWGLNSGLLDGETYLEPTVKAWKYLYEVALLDTGMIGYSQQVGSNATNASPQSAEEPFGTGAFLLAAAEMSKLAGGLGGDIDENGRDNGDIYPYLLHRMNGSYAFELGSPHFFAGTDGRIMHLDNNNYSAKAFTDEGDSVVLPAAAFENMGYTVRVDGTDVYLSTAANTVAANRATGAAVEGVDIDGTFYVSAEAAAEAIGYHIWSDGDLYVISERETPFFDCERAAVDMLCGMIGPAERYPDRTGQSEEEKSGPMSEPYGEEIELSYDMVWQQLSSADDETANPKKNAFDNNSDTFWAAGSGDRYMVIDLGQPAAVTCIGILPRSYTDGRMVNYVLSYSLDGVNYTELFDGASAVNGGIWEYHDAESELVRYIRIDTKGSSINNGWAAISEISVYQNTDYTVTVWNGKLDISGRSSYFGVTATPEPQNGKSNLVDGDIDTYWAAQGQQWCTIRFDEPVNVSDIRLIFKKYDDDRRLKYSIDIYGGGKSYQLFDGQGDDYVWIDHAVNKTVSEVRIDLKGSTVGDWASLSEIEIYEDTYDIAEIQGTPEYEAELSSELCAVAADDPLAIGFKYENAPEGSALEISGDDFSYVECVRGSGLAVISPFSSNKPYTATLTTSHGEKIAEDYTASLYSALAEHLGSDANLREYLADGAELSSARIAHAAKILSDGGVFLVNGKLTAEGALLMELSGTTVTIKPDIVKLGIAFVLTENGIRFGSSAPFNSAQGEAGKYYDVLTISGNTGILSQSDSFSANFPGAEPAEESVFDMGGDLVFSEELPEQKGE